MRQILYLLLMLSLLPAAAGPMHFERLTIEDGLSQNSVFYSLRDSQGFMWLGTLDGLNRYDGYQFKVYRHDPNIPGTIAGNIINSMVEDSQGNLWIGTDNGLSRYDREQDRFDVYRHHPGDSSSLAHNTVQALVIDNQQRLWVATAGGLNLFDHGRFTRFVHDPKQSESISNNNVKALYIDNLKQLWVGTEDGLNRYFEREGRFVRYYHRPDHPGSLSSSHISAILEDSDGEMWIGTIGGGLNRWGRERGTFKHFRYDAKAAQGLSNDNIKTLLEDDSGTLWIGSDGGVNLLDRQTGLIKSYRHRNGDNQSLGSDFVVHIYDDGHGIIWVGTAGGAVNRFLTRRQRFGHFNHQSGVPGSLSHNMVLNLHVDSRDRLWVATRGGGLNYYDQQQGRFFQYRHDKDDPGSISDDYVTFVFEDDRKHLWVGTGSGGLNRLDRAGGRFQHFRAEPGAVTRLQSDHIRFIFQDNSGKLWIATTEGLSLFDYQRELFTTFRHDPNDPYSLSHNWVKSLYQDKAGNLWVTTQNGFNRFLPQSQTFERYLPDTEDPTRLSHGNVNFILQDSRGDYWVGTYGGGLNRFDLNNGTFERYRGAKGLPNDVIYGGLEDDNGKLWFSTNLGLFKFDPLTAQFKNYDANDGVQRNEFNRNAYFKSRHGELFFGGLNGFNRFFPKDIVDNPRAPQIAFTEFLLFNQPVAVASPKEQGHDGFYLPKAINSAEQVTLDHTQSLISVEFAGFDFTNPGKVRYAYKMEGLDKQWIYTDSKNRRATYTHLPAGHYRLLVKAANADGVWNEQGIALAVDVLSPPWLSWWAFVLYGLLFLALIYVVLAMRLAHNKARDQAILNRELREIDQLKDAFLANTSHELRTPLNGIIGIAESMIDGAAGKLPLKAIKNLSMVVASGQRLADLINDILDFSKLKHGQMSLKQKPLDVKTLTDIVLTLLAPLLKHKDVSMLNQVPADLCAVMADENRLLQILHNLVGNAIKFTDSGFVTVSAWLEDDRVKVAVKDSGIGIDAAQFEQIFEDFRQADSDDSRAFDGSGLGLSITKQLVELHGGTIEVESVVGQGSTFTITLPKAQGQAQNTMSVELQQTYDDAQNDVLAEQDIPLDLNADGFDGTRFRILLVDDEPINLQVLSNHLQLAGYSLEQAHDGIEALEKIEQKGPFDLVLLDIMMPKLSGYEVCKQIRARYSVSDLPVIFLTAKNQVEDMVQGFAVGANDHLTKPVSKHELLSRVKTHLKLLDINRSLESKVSERTEQMVEAQKRLDLSEKLAQLGGLMAGVAHEINNPTNFVHVSIQSLEHDLAKCQQFIFDLAADADEEILESFRHQFEPLHQHISTIKDGTYRIKNIVSDLKTSTHFSQDDKKVVCITDMLSSTINLVSTNYKEFARIDSRFAYHPDIRCYPSKLNQVFVNLLVNAFDAIKQKHLQMPQTPEGLIVVASEAVARDGRQWVRLSVRDNGTGIDEAVKTRLFEPYFTTKGIGHGSGLGLSISREIVQAHGGDLSVASEFGQYCEFCILLPVEE